MMREKEDITSAGKEMYSIEISYEENLHRLMNVFVHSTEDKIITTLSIFI